MVEIEIEVTHEAGLHLRPAALFVQTAAKHQAEIQVCNVSRDTPFCDAKSSIGVMTLGVNQGHRVVIRAEGDDAEEALAALQALIESNFGESEPGDGGQE